MTSFSVVRRGRARLRIRVRVRHRSRRPVRIERLRQKFRKTGSFEDEIEIVGLAELLAEALDAGGTPEATANTDTDAETGAAQADD